MASAVPTCEELYGRAKFANGQAVTETALRHLIDDGHGAAPPLKPWLDEPSRAAILNYLKNY